MKASNIFRTELERVPLKRLVAPSDGVFFVGSCFTEHIGSWLSSLWLPVTCNPWGVLFNPASIARSLMRASHPGQDYVPELHELGGRYCSFDHHGQFDAASSDEVLSRISEAEKTASSGFAAAGHIFVTFGTSWIYERQGRVVANCHKFPASEFSRRMLAVDEIVALFTPLIGQKHWVFTVSPIRHVRDGLHANQLSKATLLMAIDRLQQLFPEQVEYLPVYELFIDDLRDYRFYADDLVHPSSMGISLVRELLSDCCFSPVMQQYVQEASAIRRQIDHRPSDPESEQYKTFINQALQRRENLILKYINV